MCVNSPKALITFIVPVFNHASYITRCLDSILECSNGLYCELLITDDGSIDSSSELVSAWLETNGDFFLRTQFRICENKGVSKTLNEMLATATGEFIAPIASDDYFLFSGFRARLDFAISNTQYDVVLGDAIVVDEQGRLQAKSAFFELHSANKKAFINGGRDLVSELIFRWSVAGPCGLIHRRLYQRVGGYNESLRVEDRDFYLRILAIGKVYFFNDFVAAYRVHSKNFSLTAKNREKVNFEISLVNSKCATSFHGLNCFYLWTYRFNCLNGKVLVKFIQKLMALTRFILRCAFDLKLKFSR